MAARRDVPSLRTALEAALTARPGALAKELVADATALRDGVTSPSHLHVALSVLVREGRVRSAPAGAGCHPSARRYWLAAGAAPVGACDFCSRLTTARDDAGDFACEAGAGCNVARARKVGVAC
jgi:hypothetical protein